MLGFWITWLLGMICRAYSPLGLICYAVPMPALRSDIVWYLRGLWPSDEGVFSSRDDVLSEHLLCSDAIGMPIGDHTGARWVNASASQVVLLEAVGETSDS